jgi:hypothetical protein
MEQKNNLESKIDAILLEIEKQSRILERNTQSLIIHEKRTDLAEHKLKILEMELERLKEEEKEQYKEINDKLEPIATHVNAVGWILKYLIPAGAAIIVAMYKLGLFSNIK